MPSLNERLLGIYGNDRKEPENKSWIPERKFKKGDFLAEAMANCPDSQEMSQHHAEEMLDEDFLFNQGRDDVFCCVWEYLLTEYGEEGFDDRWNHFQESWDKHYDKYGKDLVFALAEVTDELCNTPFVNYAGYLDKEMVKELVASVRRRARSK